MSDKLNAALTNLERARASALDAALGERAYRLCVLLDAEGRIQKSIERARKMIAPRETKTKKARKS
jgi:hypothetical protein